MTHAIFLNATEETIENIRRWDCHLIIDEAPDPVSEFNKTTVVEREERQSVNRQDLKMLLDNGTIQVDEKTGLVTWTGKSYDGGKYSAVERMAKRGGLYPVRGLVYVVRAYWSLRGRVQGKAWSACNGGEQPKAEYGSDSEQELVHKSADGGRYTEAEEPPNPFLPEHSKSVSFEGRDHVDMPQRLRAGP